MGSARQLTYGDLAISLVLVGVVLAISWYQRLGVERPLLIGTARSFLQLVMVGYVLAFIFHAQGWYWTLLFLAVMAAVAVHTAVQRQKRAVPGLFLTMSVSIAGGSFLILAIVIGLVIRPRHWYDPQYTVPLAGMILGNSMTAGALAVERLSSEIRARRLQIEAALSLGATSRQAGDWAIRAAVNAALLPTINVMMVVGIVQLPGMMTGQILAGNSPQQAVNYQILVTYMIAAAAALTGVSAALLAHRSTFTTAHQLREL